MAGATAGGAELHVYYLRDRDTLADVLGRSEQAGFGAIVLTVDTPHVATRRATSARRSRCPTTCGR